MRNRERGLPVYKIEIAEKAFTQEYFYIWWLGLGGGLVGLCGDMFGADLINFIAFRRHLKKEEEKKRLFAKLDEAVGKREGRKLHKSYLYSADYKCLYVSIF